MTGAIFGIVMIFSILFSQWTLALLLFLISFLGLLEFYKITKSNESKPQNVTGILIAQLLFFIFIVSLNGIFQYKLLLIAIPLTVVIFII